MGLQIVDLSKFSAEDHNVFVFVTRKFNDSSSLNVIYVFESESLGPEFISQIIKNQGSNVGLNFCYL